MHLLGEAPDCSKQLMAAVASLDGWIRGHGFAAYDPFDGLASFLRPLTFGTKRGRQLLVQGVKRWPWNLRPLLGIRPATSSKGMGFLARAYLRLFQLDGDPAWSARAEECLDWLRAHRSMGYSGPCWGNHFDYQTRSYYLPAGQPTVVWSSLIGQAFVDAFEASGREADLAEARGICEFVLRDLPRHRVGDGVCISYVAHADIRVHNANALAAGLLARVYGHTREGELYEVATQALAYAAQHQNEDGSWFYGEQNNLHWIDNWHSAYVLDSFLDYESCTGNRRFREACRQGWNYYFVRFFEDDGCPRYYHDRTYPIDIQCAAQSIETLCRFRHERGALEMSEKVAQWTIRHMRDKSGYFYFQRHPAYLNRTPCFHWAQSTMMSALSLLLLCLQNRESHGTELAAPCADAD
jgi:hypothetical protein